MLKLDICMYLFLKRISNKSRFRSENKKCEQVMQENCPRRSNAFLKISNTLHDEILFNTKVKRLKRKTVDKQYRQRTRLSWFETTFYYY